MPIVTKLISENIYFVKNSSGFFKVLLFIFAIYKLAYIPLASSDLHIWIAEGLKVISSPFLVQKDISSIHQLSLNYPSHFSGVVLAFIYSSFGDLGVLVFSRLISAFTILLIFKTWIHKYPMDIKLFILAISSFVGIEFLLDRPAVLVLPLVLILTLLIENIDTKTKNNDYLTIFLIVVLWTNLHPSSLILIPVVLYKITAKLILDKKIDLKLSFLLPVLFLAICSTPIFFDIWKYSFETILLSKQRVMVEWTSVFSLYYPSYSVLYIINLLVFFVLLVQKKKLRAFFLSSFPVFCFIGVFSIRNIMYFFLFLVPLYQIFILNKQQNDIEYNESKGIILRGSFIVVSLVFLIFLVFKNPISDRSNRGGFNKYFKGNEVRVFTEMESSGFLSASTNNRVKTFIDSRNVIFSSDVISDYLSIINGVDSILLLEKYKMNFVIIQKKRRHLIEAISTSAEWTRLDTIDGSVGFRRATY